MVEFSVRAGRNLLDGTVTEGAAGDARSEITGMSVEEPG
jgi:hypothetical protein